MKYNNFKLFSVHLYLELIRAGDLRDETTTAYARSLTDTSHRCGRIQADFPTDILEALCPM